MSTIRDNWRIALLIVAVAVSLFLLFSPTMGTASAASNGPTNLKYGLQLSGGTSIRAPLVGWTAEGIQYDGSNTTAVEDAVSDRLPGVPTRNVEMVSPATRGESSWALEVRDNVTKSAVQSAVSGAGLSPDTVRPGVTKPTRQETVTILQDKIDETGIQGGQVRSVFSVGTQRHLITVEVPSANRTEVLNLLNDRGRVQVLAYHGADRNGTTVYTNRTTLTNDDFQRVSVPQQSAQGPYVSVVVKEQVAPRFREDMIQTGIASQGGSGCGFPREGSCLLIVNDGEIVGQFGMEPSLANSMRSGAWGSSNQRTFILPTGNFSAAQRLSVNLRAGELPTGLAIRQGTVEYVSPTLGASARLNALVAAIVAVLAVSVVVGLRYGDFRIAVPMVLTGLAEVVLMLGFASGVGLALGLSHIAGFIAVIGTGVDDLIIIADEIMQEGDVATDRVFRSRFRKALWVIGGAAATTIVAMSPLAVMSLQDLQGFAIVTIVGVLLGVLVTRPAYGDILRNLVMD
ncbi:MAG: preprotein translocase subunit SecD [Haloarculaceae archaeon]